MDDDQAQARPGLTDAELATHPTVFAADALRDLVVVVSGGAGGIGRAIAWLFARLGAHVAVVGRDQGKLDKLVADLAARNLRASAHTADIREPEAVKALFDTVWSAHGRVDILTNSAGGQFPQAAIDFSIKGWNAVIDTNLNGTWYMMQAAAQRWPTTSIPAASSISWWSPRTGSTASRIPLPRDPASSDFRAVSRSNGRR
jgi:citronellol/citronellal dehydrogenase